MLNLPFAIGADYEIWEYQLEIKEDKLKNYDSYIYFGNIDFYSTQTDNIELIFNYDILELVILTYEKLKKKDFETFKKLIYSKLGESKPLTYKSSKIEIYTLDGELELWFIHNPSDYKLEIGYGNNKILKELYL
ncbi:hypothetical protein J2X97_003771 [Epilithonimonas hungarica]|uniref:hypothetical protein n=1 Tax=Epilithonimonas hungarica TaxID=454006 RepID=UPI002786AFA4|nr:hypothetical protein [Epilithonimonas hungarica]MDP9958097.1 hypothetical protein [Epilithonimonas hungarica]